MTGPLGAVGFGRGRILCALLRYGPAKARLEPAFTPHLAVVLKALTVDARGIAWLPPSMIEAELADGRPPVRAGAGQWATPVDIRLFRRALQGTPAAQAFRQVAEAGGGGASADAETLRDT